MNLSGFDLNLLKVLDALLREGSTVRAGRRVGLSQPAVSAALSRLRHSLNDPLFVRQGQGLAPTAFARQLREPLQDALALIDGVLHGPGGFDPAHQRAVFRLSGSDFFTDLLLPPLLRDIRRSAPGVEIEMVDLVFDTALSGFERHDVDLAFWPSIALPHWLVAEEVMTSGMVICAPVDQPQLRQAGITDGDAIPLDLFCDIDQVQYAPDGVRNTFGDEELAKRGRSRTVVATMPTFGGVYRMIAEAGLIGSLPSQFAALRKAEGKITVHPVPFDIGTNHLCMIWRNTMTNDPAHQWLRRQIADILLPLTDS